MSEELRKEIEELLKQRTATLPTKEEIDALIKEANENNDEDAITFTGAEIENLIIEAERGDEKAKEALEYLSQEEETKNFIDEVKESIIKTAEVIKQIETISPELAKALDIYNDDNKVTIITEAIKKINELRQIKAPKNEIKKYRTKGNAGDIITNYPDIVVTPTYRTYENAISLNQRGNTYLTPLQSTDGLKFQNGQMFFDDDKLKPISTAMLKDMQTNETIQDIDLPLLRVFYTLILTKFKDDGSTKLDNTISLYVPDIACYLGHGANISKSVVKGIISKIEKVHNIIGIVKEPYGGVIRESIYPVLTFQGYDSKTNTIHFSSPYMNHVISTIYNVSIRKDKKGSKLLKTNGEPLRLPTHSYLIKSEIIKEPNKRAVENVFIIITTLEQAGGKGAHIALTTIIERNPQLKEALETSSNIGQLLQRCFCKTWELLKTKTKLAEKYKNVRLAINPTSEKDFILLNDLESTNPVFTPTAKTYSGMVLNIRHDGKVAQ